MVILVLDRLKVMQPSIILDFRIFFFFYNEYPFSNVIKNILHNSPFYFPF